MKNWKALTGILLVIILCWHIAMAMTHRLGIAGIFLAKPAEPGYVWIDADNSESRFFWHNTDVRWQEGMTHPEFNAETTETEGIWNPLPGYAFIDQSQGPQTVWKQGLQHPDYMAWSDHVEGQWIPITGYKFIYNGDTFVDTIWDPNQRYNDLKVMSLAEKDHYKPFPGYTFVEPGRSLKVTWTPGTIHSDNSRLIAGTTEGSWTVNAARRRPARRGGNEAAWFIGGVATGILLRSL